MTQRKRRRRRRLNWRFFLLLAALAGLLAFLISSCHHAMNHSEATTTTADPTVYPEGWIQEGNKRYYQKADGTRAVGWLDADGTRYYLNANGTPFCGWLEEGNKRYYLQEDGSIYTGWLEQDGKKYYIREDGSMAKGTVKIDGVDHHFTSAGTPILVVNPWNYLPEGYEPDLVELGLSISVEGSMVDRSCYDALLSMISDCNKECPEVCVVSSYRTMEYQTNSYNKKVNSYLNLGYSEEDAKKEAATIIAVPGTSEHQLGLAVDIVDTRLWALEEEQEDLPAQKWLMENSWKYGFILRYPKNKINVTGIIYEPWHYRYVGLEVAQELHNSGLTLEEYLQNLTN